MARIEKYTEIRVQFGNRPEMKVGDLHVIERDGEVWMVDFHCPCGCGHSSAVFIVNSRRPRTPDRHVWDYNPAKPGEPRPYLISPSVHWTAGCLSHFFIRGDGTVQWC